MADFYRMKACAVCSMKSNVVGHHIKSFKSGGECTHENMLPLCTKHHAEIHTIGLNSFAKKYETVKQQLKWKRWQYDGFMQKWMRLEDGGWVETETPPPCPYCEEGPKKCDC